MQARGAQGSWGYIADIVDRHEVVPGLASQGRNFGMFVSPSRACESACGHATNPKAERTPRELDLNLLGFNHDPHVERRGNLAAPTKRCCGIRGWVRLETAEAARILRVD